MSQSLPAHPVPFYRGPAEVAFGNEAVLIHGNTSQSAMQLGAWALHGDGSAVHQGAAGVLVDDATAYAVLSSRHDDQWGVTSEISVDFHAPIPLAAKRLTCSATVNHRTQGWGHSSGHLRADNGDLVATVGQRMRFFPGDDSPHRQPGEPTGAPSWLDSLDNRLELMSRDSTQSEFRLHSDPGMRNPLGTLHGGVSLAFTELAARKAWAESEAHPGEPFDTSAIRMSYLRPGLLGRDFQLTVNIIHSSRSVVIAEVRNQNTDGETITFGLVTLHRMPSI